MAYAGAFLTGTRTVIGALVLAVSILGAPEFVHTVTVTAGAGVAVGAGACICTILVQLAARGRNCVAAVAPAVHGTDSVLVSRVFAPFGAFLVRVALHRRRVFSSTST